MKNEKPIELPITVFLDTNVFIKACFNFSSGQMSNLRKYNEAGLIKILTNEIVVKEVNNKIEDEVTQASSHIKNLVKKERFLSELRNSGEFSYIFKDFRKEGWSNYILQKWEKFRDDLNFINIEIDSVDFLAIVNDYFERNPPFEEKKKEEFPDAIIINSIKNYFKKVKDELIVVSEDKGWVNAFKKYDRIFLISEISDLLNRVSYSNSPELIDKLIDAYSENKELFTNSIYESVSDYNISYIPYVEDHMVMGNDVSIYDIEDIDIELAEHAISCFDYVSKDVSEVTVTAKIAFTFSYSEIDYENSYFDKEENKYLFLAEHHYKERHETSVDIKVEFEYNEDADEFECENVEVDEILISYDTCTASFTEDNYENICPDCGGPLHFYNDAGTGFCTKCSSNH